jgi:arylsulfatase A-like enzyme
LREEWAAGKAAALSKPGHAVVEDRGWKVRQVQNNPVYAAMVESMDESAVRILGRLTELGLDKNTIVIFTSDNGGLSTGPSPTSNLPLRGSKGWPYEGGIREPLIVRWPGVTKPGSVSGVPVISTDYLPTLLQMAGLPPLPGQHLDAASFVPALEGEKSPDRPLFWHYPHYSINGGTPSGAVRHGDFKLVEWFEDMSTELFDLRHDPGEHVDLSKENPEKTQELKSLLHAWRRDVNAQMPEPNPKYRPETDPFARKPAGREKASGPKQGESGPIHSED